MSMMVLMMVAGRDKSCSKSNGYRRNPCSECVCVSSSFTGPTCEGKLSYRHVMGDVIYG